MAHPTDRALDLRRPFTRAEARAGGIGLAALLSPQFHKVLYDAYVLASVPITVPLRADAALHVSAPGAYVSHHTAAALWGGVPPDTFDVHLTVPPTVNRCRRQGVRVHAKRPPAAPPVWLKGRPVTSPTETFLDLAAAGLTLTELVVLGDSLVRAGRTTPADLVATAEHAAGRGVRRARRAAGLVRAGVDSPMETLLRLLLVLAGLPEPQVNHVLRRPDGSWLMRFDLYYEEQRLIIEFDGRQHAESTTQWQRDLARREQIDARGDRILVVTGRDLLGAPEQVLRRVQAALVERGAVGVRRVPKSEWRRHFVVAA